MSFVSVSAVYDGEHVHLLEAAPVQGPYRVLVTFVGPTGEQASAVHSPSFLASFGAWQDDRPIEATLGDIAETRLSRDEPPTL